MNVHIIPTLTDNYSYVISRGQDAMLIDCGDAAPVVHFLKKNNLNLKYILCTHHHWDHIDGLPELKRVYPDAPIYAPAKDRYRIPSAEHDLEDQMNLLDTEIIVIETPGHTLNHVVFYLPGLKALFSGDTLFSGGCGRLFEGTPAQMFASLQKLKALPDKTLIYAGHEYSETNMKFALLMEPDNQKFLARLKEITALKENGRPSLPISLKAEKAINIFLQAETVQEFARLREARNQF